jgi:hypothetical protein
VSVDAAAEVLARLFRQGKLMDQALVKTQCRWTRDAWASKSATQSFIVPSQMNVGSEGVSNQLRRTTSRTSCELSFALEGWAASAGDCEVEEDYLENFPRTLRALEGWAASAAQARSRTATSRTSRELSGLWRVGRPQRLTSRSRRTTSRIWGELSVFGGFEALCGGRRATVRVGAGR